MPDFDVDVEVTAHGTITDGLVQGMVKARFILASAVLFFMVASSAQAANTSTARLDTISSSIAQRDAPVYCEDDQLEWNSWVDQSPATGFTNAGMVYISPRACAGLHELLAHHVVNRYGAAVAITTLLYEDFVLRLGANPGVAECDAHQAFASSLTTVFEIPTRAPWYVGRHVRLLPNPLIPELIGYERYVHDSLPAEFRAVC